MTDSEKDLAHRLHVEFESMKAVSAEQHQTTREQIASLGSRIDKLEAAQSAGFHAAAILKGARTQEEMDEDRQRSIARANEERWWRAFGIILAIAGPVIVFFITVGL